MKIVMVSLVLNIHEAGVADSLYELTNGDYRFIETAVIDEESDKGGCNKQFVSRPYLVRVSDGQTVETALTLVREADVVLFGAAPVLYLKERLKTGKLTFMVSERWLKRGVINILSPRLLKKLVVNYVYGHNKPYYALCASAYASGDFAKILTFKDKCFKWGYFTSVPTIDMASVQGAKCASTVKILWVARFLQWKHPERMLQLASQLRGSNIDYSIDMIGTGPEYDKIASEVKKQGLENHVHLLGKMSNSEVMETMRSHHIFCFTSDKNEGWGAVLNEAMSSGCCPVSSIEAGSTPYLIKDGVNGLSFDLKKENDLFEKVLWLIEHSEEREKMSIEAYKTMRDVWSPKNAATQLVKLCEAIQNGDTSFVADGPCSRAF